MPTIITKTVKSSGGDYSSLISAEAGEQGDLVALDRQLNIECYSFDDNNSSQFSLDGWTTDTTRYVKIYTPSTERHDGKWNTSKYRFRVTSGFAGFFNSFKINEDYTIIDGLQVSAEPDSGNSRGAVQISDTTAGCRVSNNVIRVVPGVSQTSHLGIALGHSGGNVFAWNNIIYLTGGTPTSSSEGVKNDTGNFTYNCYCYNNTVYGWATGIHKIAGNAIVAKNNLCNGNTTDYSGSFDASSVGNISEDTTSPNSSLRSKVVTFVDEANFDLRLDSSDTSAKNAGTDLSGDSALPFSTDIVGSARTVLWDIGAWEIVSSAVALVQTSSSIFKTWIRSLKK